MNVKMLLQKTPQKSKWGVIASQGHPLVVKQQPLTYSLTMILTAYLAYLQYDIQGYKEVYSTV